MVDRLTRRKVLAACVPIAVLGATLTGCRNAAPGSSVATASPTTTTIAGPTILRRGDAGFMDEFEAATDRFLEASAQVQAQGRAALQAQAGVGVRDVYAELLTTTRQARAEYAALAPPPEVAPDLNRLLLALDRQTGGLEKVVRAIEAKDGTDLTTPLSEIAIGLDEMQAAQLAVRLKAQAESGPP